MKKQLIASVLVLLIVIANIVLTSGDFAGNSESYIVEKAICPVEPEVTSVDAMTDNEQAEMETRATFVPDQTIGGASRCFF